MKGNKFMRKRFHFIGVITLAVLTLFTLSACPDPDPEVIQDVTISVDSSSGLELEDVIGAKYTIFLDFFQIMTS